MARYTGPVCRLCRRAGEKLFLKGERCLTPKCAVERRQTPPGTANPRRRKVSERGQQLREKQRARQIYGVLERQFRRYFAEAERRPGITGELLLQLLERRLDNVVYRMGLADSRAQARQLVNHGHFQVNGRRTNIPSFLVRANDVISLHPSSANNEYFKVVKENIQRKAIPTWISLDLTTLTGRVLTLPARSDIDIRINEQAIVEFYSR
jgi:small subunit ribosomal protein S4